MPAAIDLRRRMDCTGIGFAGIEGCWWLPATEAFVLPAAVHLELAAAARALFALLDAVAESYQADAGLRALLEYKVPSRLLGFIRPGRVDFLRPDFQLVPTADGLQVVATELEICPAAQGFAHAMQIAYGLAPDLAPALARYLSGRTLLIAGVHAWSPFLFEQLAFCQALAGYGARAFVLYDRPISQIAAEVRRGARWQPPMFGVRARPPAWEDDVWKRIRRRGLEAYLWPGDERWPESVGDAVIFRFGYIDNFAPRHLALFARWQAQGTTLLNPPLFWLDSKVLLAARDLPSLRARMADTGHLAVLDRCLPPTQLLTPERVEYLRTAQESWLLKFAGFDGGEQAWGGRSLRVGRAMTSAAWRATLQKSLELPWPVIAQRLTPSSCVDIDYYDADGQQQRLPQGTTRLRAFFLRQGTDCLVLGSHLTVCGGTMQVSEATDAVQAPVSYR